jgi:hypothetical protein
MQTFLQKHSQKINGVLSCFDRMIFKGYLPFQHPKALSIFLYGKKLLYKQFMDFAKEQAEKLKTHAQKMAERNKRPFEYLNGYVRKEDKARQIAQRDKVKQGLVCVFSTLETASSFVLRYGIKKPQLEKSWRKCLHLYFYFMHPQFGLMHVRLQTFFPFTIQVYANGHEWLEKQMDKKKIAYRKVDNAFSWIEDPERAQDMANSLSRQNWRGLLDSLAKTVNPLLKDVMSPYEYYWVTAQAELSTDVMFKSREALKPLYQKLLKHNVLCFGAEDILTFLSRKLHPLFAGEVGSDLKTQRVLGARIKHRMKANWIKMYDKQGLVLRIETVINDPREFKIRKTCERKGKQVKSWVPLNKSVVHLDAYAKIALKANRLYLEAMATLEDPAFAMKKLDQIAEAKTKNDRKVKGFNPVDRSDINLFTTVLRGEHVLRGLRNNDVRQKLFGDSSDKDQIKKDSAKVTRSLGRLHAHQLIAKIPRSRRWKVTSLGNQFMSASIHLREETFPQLLKDAA